MTKERWQQVKGILEEALDRAPEQRAAFLSEVCAGDETLHLEVESLLFRHGQDSAFIEQPVFGSLTSFFADTEPAPVLTGRTVGSYQVLHSLGVGGMGEVYLAQDLQHPRKVALKILSPKILAYEDGRRRFQQEVFAASALNHPNIVTVYDSGEVEDRPYLVMEYIQGQTLREVLQSGPLPLAQVLEIGLQVASALETAHRLGIVHRDIKPENLMVRQDGYVKVLDFGLAKLIDDPLGIASTTPGKDNRTVSIQVEMLLGGNGNRVHSRPGLVAGTLSYLAPEQIQSQAVDSRTDIFSLGVVLYEMLAGVAPFQGDTLPELLAAILQTQPAPLTQAPKRVEAIIFRALSKENTDRPQTAQQLVEALRDLRKEAELQKELRALLQDNTEKPRKEAQVELPAISETSGWLAGAERQRTRFTNGISLLALRIGFAWTSWGLLCGFLILTIWLAWNYKGTEKFGYRTRLAGRQQLISEVHPAGPANGKLLVGDRILALDGDAVFSRVDVFTRLPRLAAGQTYQLRIERGQPEAPISLELQLSNLSYPHQTPQRWTQYLTHLARALICLIVAGLFLWLQPRETFARIACWAFLTITILELRVVLNPLQTQLAGWPYFAVLFFWSLTGGHLFVPFAFQTAYQFPVAAFRPHLFWNLVQWLLYGGLAVGFSRGFLSRLFGELPQNYAWLAQHADHFAAIKTFADWYYPLGLVAISAVMLRNYRIVLATAHRRRIRWVLAGTLTATVPLTLIELLRLGSAAWGKAHLVDSPGFQTLELTGNAIALAFPLSWAYAILKRQIYDVRVVLRRGVQYLLARNALRSLLTVLFVSLVYQLILHREQSVQKAIWSNEVFWGLSAILIAVLYFRRELREWLDQRFFRELYLREQLLRQWLESSHQNQDLADLLRQLRNLLTQTLAPRLGYFFFRTPTREFQLLETINADLFAQRLGGRLLAGHLEFWHEVEQQARGNSLAAEELRISDQRLLSGQGIELIIPCQTTTGEIAGALLLGMRENEEPYSLTERHILTEIARQLVLVWSGTRQFEKSNV